MVYQAYGRLVYAVLLRVLGDRGRAAAATEEAFMRVWRAMAAVEGEGEIGPLLAAITRGPADQEVSIAALDDAWNLRQAVDRLPSDEREIVRLRHLDGLNDEEMARRIGAGESTVRARCLRAHKRLATQLGWLREEPVRLIYRQDE